MIVYGDSKLKRDHPVVAFLANDKHAKSLAIYKEGCAHHCVGMPCCSKPNNFPVLVQCIKSHSHSSLVRRFVGFQKAYPFLCSASVKNNAVKR